MKKKRPAPINFNSFKKCMDAIIDENEYVAECSRLNINFFEKLHCEFVLVQLLDQLFGGYGNVEWWCYEKDFGRREEMKVTLHDGTVIPTETVEDLYKFLCFSCEYECNLHI